MEIREEQERTEIKTVAIGLSAELESRTGEEQMNYYGTELTEGTHYLFDGYSLDASTWDKVKDLPIANGLLCSLTIDDRGHATNVKTARIDTAIKHFNGLVTEQKKAKNPNEKLTTESCNTAVDLFKKNLWANENLRAELIAIRDSGNRVATIELTFTAKKTGTKMAIAISGEEKNLNIVGATIGSNGWRRGSVMVDTSEQQILESLKKAKSETK